MIHQDVLNSSYNKLRPDGDANGMKLGRKIASACVQSTFNRLPDHIRLVSGAIWNDIEQDIQGRSVRQRERERELGNCSRFISKISSTSHWAQQ